MILAVGLVIVLANLSEKKIPLLVKSFGPCFVCLGLTAMLLTKLFIGTPTVWTGWGNKNKKEKIDRDSKTLGNNNYSVELSNGDLGLIETITSSEKLRSRH